MRHNIVIGATRKGRLVAWITSIGAVANESTNGSRVVSDGFCRARIVYARRVAVIPVIPRAANKCRRVEVFAPILHRARYRRYEAWIYVEARRDKCCGVVGQYVSIRLLL